MTQIGEEHATGSILPLLRQRILAFASCEVSDGLIWVPIMGPWAQAWAHHGPIMGPWGAQAWVHHGPMGGPSLGPSWAHGGPKLGPIMGPWGA